MKPSEVHKKIAKHMNFGGDEIVVDLEKSTGAYLVNAVTGEKYIDFFTYFASAPLGHNHPKLREADFIEELMTVAVTKPSCSDFLTTYMAEFVETFSRVAMPVSMPHLFLISGGALAVENALKTAFDWKVRMNFGHICEAGGKDGQLQLDGFGGKVIHFQEAFHGRTGYTLSMTNTTDPRKYLYFPKFDWPRVVNPKLRFPVTDEVQADVARMEQVAVAQIEAAVKQYPGEIAALIIEPIQGEGGDNHFRPQFFQELRRLADEHEFLFIVDEVQSGMGITGVMWAVEHMGVEPDIIAFGKKSQVCGIIAGTRIDEVEGHVFEEGSRINSTFGGNLTDMVRAMRYLEIIEDQDLLAHTTRMGGIMLSGLREIAEASDGLVSNVRGRGMMIAFDLPDERTRDQVLKQFQEDGLLALKCGPRSIRFRGMLDVPQEVVEKALEIIDHRVKVA